VPKKVRPEAQQGKVTEGAKRPSEGAGAAAETGARAVTNESPGATDHSGHPAATTGKPAAPNAGPGQPSDHDAYIRRLVAYRAVALAESLKHLAARLLDDATPEEERANIIKVINLVAYRRDDTHRNLALTMLMLHVDHIASLARHAARPGLDALDVDHAKGREEYALHAAAFARDDISCLLSDSSATVSTAGAERERVVYESPFGKAHVAPQFWQEKFASAESAKDTNATSDAAHRMTSQQVFVNHVTYGVAHACLQEWFGAYPEFQQPIEWDLLFLAVEAWTDQGRGKKKWEPLLALAGSFGLHVDLKAERLRDLWKHGEALAELAGK
jgi:hypothetical protein